MDDTAYAYEDGSGTITLDGNTEQVVTGSLDDAMAALVRIALRHAAATGDDVELLAYAGTSPAAGLRISPSGSIVEDPTLTGQAPAKRPPWSFPAVPGRSPGGPGDRPDPRRGLLAGAAALALAASIGGCLALTGTDDPSPAAASPTPTPAPVATPTKAPIEPAVRVVSRRPNTVTVAYTLPRAHRGTIRVVINPDKGPTIRKTFTIAQAQGTLRLRQVPGGAARWQVRLLPTLPPFTGTLAIQGEVWSPPPPDPEPAPTHAPPPSPPAYTPPPPPPSHAPPPPPPPPGGGGAPPPP